MVIANGVTHDIKAVAIRVLSNIFLDGLLPVVNHRICTQLMGDCCCGRRAAAA